jgi:DNA-binding NtrC family response regulator
MARNSPRGRVLIVDDEPLIRWSLSETLGDAGYDVVEAGDGEGAMDAASLPDTFDVVLLDFRLPDSNDLNLLSRLRVLAPQAQIVLMTAFGTPEITRGALDRGAYRVVSKPFEVGEMASLVAEAATQRPADFSTDAAESSPS